MENVVVPDGQIKQVAGRDPRRIMVIVFGSWRGNRDARRAKLRWRAAGQRRAQRGNNVAAEQSCLELLISSQAGEIDRSCAIGCEWNCAGDESAVIAPVEADPWSSL